MKTQRSPTENKQPAGLFFERAPDHLLEKITLLNVEINKFRRAGYSQQFIEFFESILQAMRLAYTYMQDTRYIHQRNILLENNIRFLAHYNQEIEEQLNELRTVMKLEGEGRVEGAIFRQ